MSNSRNKAPTYVISPYSGPDRGWTWVVSANGKVWRRGWARTWGEAQDEALEMVALKELAAKVLR
jgi:hypothetical protein